MTVVEDVLNALNPPLPRTACPSDTDIGDVVRFRGVDLPVIIIDSDLRGDVPDLYRVFSWISQARRSNGEPVLVGQSVPEPGELVLIEARAEHVRADQVRDGDLLLLESRTCLWGVVSSAPSAGFGGVVNIEWVCGRLPDGSPQTRGWLQRAPHQSVRRSPRGGTR